MSMSFPKCNQAGIEFVISTNEELQEESKFLSEEFPIAMYTQNFNHAASDSIPFHWHDELQITWISEGELEYCISRDKFRLRMISCCCSRVISSTAPAPPPAM